MQKKIILVILVCLCGVLLFGGCAKVEYTYVQQKHGGYQQIIDIVIDEDISQTGYSHEEVVQKLTEIFESEGYTISAYDKANRHMVASKTFATMDDIKNDALGNGIDGATYSSSEDFLFSYSDMNGIIALTNAHKRKLLLSLLEYGVGDLSMLFLVNDIETSYKFMTPYRVKTNADKSYEEGDYFVHIWDVSESEDYTIFVQNKAPRAVVWYLCALSAGLIVGVVIVARKHILRKKQKLENTEEVPFV